MRESLIFRSSLIHRPPTLVASHLAASRLEPILQSEMCHVLMRSMKSSASSPCSLSEHYEHLGLEDPSPIFVKFAFIARKESLITSRETRAFLLLSGISFARPTSVTRVAGSAGHRPLLRPRIRRQGETMALYTVFVEIAILIGQ